MMNYAKTAYMASGDSYPQDSGANIYFDRLVVLEDATFSTFSASWTVGDTAVEVTATEIPSLLANVYPGVIKDLVVTSGKVLLCRD